MAPPTEYFWLVSHAEGQSEIVKLPKGQHPTGLLPKHYRFLGGTIPEVQKYTARAAREIGVPDPRNVPSLGTSVGIISAEVAGFGAAAAGAADAAAGVAAVDTGEAAAAGAGGGATEGAAGGAAGGAASKAAGTVLKDAGLAAGAALLIKAYGLRLAEIIAGGALILFALVTLANGGKAPNVVPLPV